MSRVSCVFKTWRHHKKCSKSMLLDTEKITTDDLKSLISFYQKNPVLWNPFHPQYRNQALKNKAKEQLVFQCMVPVLRYLF